MADVFDTLDIFDEVGGEQPKTTPAEYSAKLIADPQYRKMREQFIQDELKNKPTTAGNILRSVQKTSPILSYYDVAGKLTGEASGTELPEVPYERKSKGLGVAANVKEAMGNVPASGARLTQGMIEMPGSIAEGVREQGVLGGLGSAAGGMLEGIGTTFGLKGSEAAANRWVGAPVEALADVGMVATPTIKAGKFVGKKALTSAFEKGFGVGQMPGEAASGAFETAKQKVFDSMAKMSPPSVKKAFDANWLRLAKPKNKNYATNIPEYAGKGEAIIDELIQQEREGRIEPADYSVPSQLEAVDSALNNIGKNEITPLLNSMEQAGYKASVSPIIDALESHAKKLENQFPNAAKAIRSKMELYKNRREMTPSEIQNDITVLGDSLKKDYRNLTTEQSNLTRAEIAEVEALKDMLDNVIDNIPEDIPSIREIKQKYHAGKIYQENLVSAADKEMRKANNPDWNGLRKLALIETAGGALTLNPKFMLWGLSTELLNQINTRASKPSAQIARMYRARKALGPKTRDVVTEMPQITPEATQFDPTVGARTETAPVNRPTIPIGLQEAPPVAFDPLSGGTVPVAAEGARTGGLPPYTEGPQPVSGARTGGLPPYTEGPQPVSGARTGGLPEGTSARITFEPAPKPNAGGLDLSTEGGKSVVGPEEPAAPKTITSGGMNLIAENFKKAVKEAGGGKGGVAKVAAMVGVPAAVLTKFILGDDEERRSLLAKAGGLAALTASGDLPFYARKDFKFSGGNTAIESVRSKRSPAPLTVDDLKSRIESDNNFTPFDAARALESMSDIPKKLRGLLKQYQKAEVLDRRLKGRGDMDSAAEKLISAIENYK